MTIDTLSRIETVKGDIVVPKYDTNGKILIPRLEDFKSWILKMDEDHVRDLKIYMKERSHSLKYINTTCLTDRDKLLGIGTQRADLWDSFGFGLFPYSEQVKSLMCPAKEIYVVASRGSGKSQTAAIRIIEELLLPNRQIYLVAPFSNQTKIVFDVVWNAFDTNPALLKYKKRGSNTRQDMFITTDIGSEGSTVRCMTGDNINALAGRSADLLVIDEAALLKDEALQIVKPCLARENRNGRLFAISSPREINFFAEAYEVAAEREEEIKVLYRRGDIDKFQAAHLIKNLPERGFRMHILLNPYGDWGEYAREKLRSQRSQSQYLWALFVREYDAVFDTIAGEVFTLKEDIWFPCQQDAQGRYISGHYVPKHKETVTIGVDYARVHDFTVCSAFTDTYKMVGFDRYNKVSEEENIRRIAAFIAKFHNGTRELRIAIDSTGEGASVPREVAKYLKDKYGIVVSIVAFKFTPSNKKELIDKLAIKLADETISLWDIREMKKELKGYRAEKQDSGNYVFKPRSGNDDIVCSVALAVYHIPDFQIEVY